ncbi:MAG: acyl-CoA dehydrogenase family protein [Acetobacteraceae bacterium]|nr:acyl-CoA dehydrogenase family protein [Acetobacteraceae bacterium]
MSATAERADTATTGPNARPDAASRARALAPLLEATAPRIEAGRRLPDDVLAALHGAGLFTTLLPRAYGGEELDPASHVLMLEEVAAADASTAWCLGQGTGCSMAAAYVDPAVARAIWGDDPRAVLAWGMGGAVARVVGGGYRVTGRWQFASGHGHATWMGGHCRVQEADGSIRLGPDRQPVERTMLFRHDAARWTAAWDVIGLRGTGSDAYAVEDLFVPEAYSLQRDTDEERRVDAPLYRFSTTHLYASGFAGVSLGIARGLLDAFVGLARDKTPRASAATLRDGAAIQRETAAAVAKLRSARAFLLETLRECWDHALGGGRLTLDHRAAIRLAATSAIHRAREVGDWAYAEAGATAIFEAQPFERRFRDLHAAGQQVQGRASHLEEVGRHLLGLPPNARFL